MKRISLATLIVFFVSMSMFVGLNFYPVRSVECYAVPHAEEHDVIFKIEYTEGEDVPLSNLDYQVESYYLDCGFPWTMASYEEKALGHQSFSSPVDALNSLPLRRTMPLAGTHWQFAKAAFNLLVASVSSALLALAF